jgi:hypothetical protein
VVGVQDEQEVQRLRGHGVHLVRLCGDREEHVQQVFAVAEVVPRIDEGLPPVELESRRGDRRQLRKNAMREDLAGLRIVHVHRVVVVRGHRAHDGGQHRHRMRVVPESAEKPQHAFVQHGVGANGCVELLQLAGARQLAIEQQISDFDEARMLRELLDRIAPVEENSFFTVDEGDRALAATGGDVARIEGEDALLPVEAADVEDAGPERTLANRDFRGGRAVGARQRIAFSGHGPSHLAGTSNPSQRRRRDRSTARAGRPSGPAKGRVAYSEAEQAARLSGGCPGSVGWVSRIIHKSCG